MVICCLDNVDCRVADFFAQRCGENRAWGFFDQFLTPSLDGAIPFAKMDVIAVLVADDLDLDMARIDDHFLEIDIGVVKAGFCLCAGSSKLSHEFIGIMGDPDPFSAAAGDGFDENRKS